MPELNKSFNENDLIEEDESSSESDNQLEIVNKSFLSKIFSFLIRLIAISFAGLVAKGFANSAGIFNIIIFVGIIYLIYFGFKIFFKPIDNRFENWASEKRREKEEIDFDTK